MKKRIALFAIGAILLIAGGAVASNLDQVLLDGTLIPKFVDPLPLGVPDGSPGGITVVNATPGSLLGLDPSPDYNIHVREFQAQILPSTGVPADPGSGFVGLPADTASWVWGYLTDADLTLGGVRPSFLGPVVVAKRGTPAHPTYLNELPYPAGHVQTIYDHLFFDPHCGFRNPEQTKEIVRCKN